MPSSRFFLRRKSGYMSPYPLSMFYGAWKASEYFASEGQTPSTPWIRVSKKLVQVPSWLMGLFKPWNRYTTTASGRKFV